MTQMTDRTWSHGVLVAFALALFALPCACDSRGSRGPSDAPAPGDASAADALDMLGPPTPRPIAPASLTTVTQQQPNLRWEMPDGVNSPFVELCKDRACTTPLSITARIAADGRSAVPSAALPPGWVYWRVQASSSGRHVYSPTWQFWVGHSSAKEPVDTGNGVTLDVNGDGYADILVGAPEAFSYRGAVYLYLGAPAASATIWAGERPGGRITLQSDVSDGHLGVAVASAGDVNGDGFGDFIVSRFGANSRVVHLYLGSASPSAAQWNGGNATRRIDLNAPTPGVSFGAALAGVGDVDGDGYGDFVVGASPRAHLYFGSAAPSAADWNASIRRTDVDNPGTHPDYGGAVAGAGDVNGDGYADILIGNALTLDSFTNRAYVYLGSPARSAAAWSTGGSTVRIELVTLDITYRGFGTRLAGAGDVNGDGYADFVIAAPISNPGGDPTAQTGVAQVYFGSAAPSAASWNATPSSDRIDLVSPDGALGSFGLALAGVGDVNGDGYADFVIGNSEIGDGRGLAHVYLGGSRIDPETWNGAISHPQRIELVGTQGANAGFGTSVGQVGDINGDGMSDFIIGTVSNAYVPTTDSVAQIFLGMSRPETPSWNGAAPPMRIDLASPDGDDTQFGVTVAIAAPDRRLIGSAQRWAVCGGTLNQSSSRPFM